MQIVQNFKRLEEIWSIEFKFIQTFECSSSSRSTYTVNALHFQQKRYSHILSEKVWLQSFRNWFATILIARVDPPTFKIVLIHILW